MLANPSRSSIPSLLANAAEQKPTAGRTPTTERATAIEQGRRGMYEVPAAPYQKGDNTISPWSLERAQQEIAYIRMLEQDAAAGGPTAALAKQQLRRMQKYGDIDAAHSTIAEHHAGPRSETYWRGLNEFDRAQPPTRLNANAASLPGALSNTKTDRDRPSLEDLLKRYGSSF